MDIDRFGAGLRIVSRNESRGAPFAAIAARARSQDKLSDVRVAPMRRLAAILSADVAGYSRLMQADDVGTLATLKQRRAQIAEISAVHQGRVVNTPGDAILVEFCSAVEACDAAVEIQEAIDASNEQLRPEQRMVFRVGLDLGDILVEADGSVYGNGVNIAARMESLAHPGGIVLSGKVFDEVHMRLPRRLHSLGRQRVKNICDRVRAYEVMPETAKDRSIQAAPGLASIARGLLAAAVNCLVSSPAALDANRAVSSSVE